MPDTVYCRWQGAGAVSEIFEKVFCERCGLDLSRLDKAGGAAGEQTENNADLELEQEVAAIAKQYAAAKGEESRQENGGR